MGAGIAALVIAAGAGGYLLGRPADQESAAAKTDRKILYWYDPMIPAEHHDGPGLSSMGMKLIPKYADEGTAESAGVKIDPRAVQNLGARIVEAQVGTLPSGITATGIVDRSEERRVGEECGSTCSSRGAPYHSKKNKTTNKEQERKT